MIDWIKNIDSSILLAVNGSHTAFLDQVMWFASDRFGWIPLYVFLIALVISRYRLKGVLMAFLIALVVLFADQLSSGLLKPWVQRLRPSHDPELQGLLHIVNGYRGGQYGFTSSHAANAFAVAFYLTYTTRDKIAWLPWLLFPWAILVSISRIYLGAHYPTDVLVPFVFSVPIAWIVKDIYAWLARKIDYAFSNVLSQDRAIIIKQGTENEE